MLREVAFDEQVSYSSAYLRKKNTYVLLFLASLIFGLFSGADVRASHSPDSLLLPASQFSVVEGSQAGTSVGRLVVADPGALEFSLSDAQLVGDGVSRNDAEIDATAIISVAPNGQLTVGDPTHLLAVNGPLELTVNATDPSNQTQSETVTIDILDRQVSSAGRIETPWSVNRADRYPPVNRRSEGVIEGQSIVVDGKLYAFGGFDARFSIVDSSYVYDPPTNQWTSLRPLPGGGRVGAGLATDGQDIYLAGGTARTPRRPTAAVYRYIIAEDRYEPLPRLPVPLADGELEYLDGQLYWVGGTDSTRTVDQGDCYKLMLSDLDAGWQALSPLPNPRGHFGAAVVNGRIYVLGGQHQHDGRSVTQDDVHAYDPATDRWEFVTDLPDINDVPADIKSLPDGVEQLRSAGKSHIASGVYTDRERIYMVGGEYRHGGGAAEGQRGAYYSAAVLVYEPATNRWRQLSDLRHFASDTTALRTRSGLGGIIDRTLYYIANDRALRTTELPAEVPDSQPPLPTLSSLGSQTYYRGDTLTDQPVVSVSDTSALLTFRASGLPTGLTLDSVSGTVSGIVTAEPGTYPLTLTVASSYDSTEVAEVWTIVEPLVTQLPDSLLSVGEIVSIYPNPTSSLLRIAWSGHQPPEEFTVTMYDAQGRRWEQLPVSFDRIDVANLPPGKYWVRITRPSRTTTHAVIIR